jgi:hypothetical protein
MYWFYGHGGRLNLENGEYIFGQKIQEAAYWLQEAIEAVTQETFRSDREKDNLTYTLKNPEHMG